jgi:hypothetical protein
MTDVAFGQSYDAEVPGWGSGRLIAVVSAGILSAENDTLSSDGGTLNEASKTTIESMTVQHVSLQDISEHVSKDGKLRITFGNPQQGEKYKLFAFYEILSLRQNMEFATNDTNSLFDYGSFNVDHFSRNGAQAFIDFWQEHILTDEVRELLISTGGSGKSDDCGRLAQHN